MGLPNLTPEQRTNALKKATESREKRAKLKRDLKAGTLTAKSVLDRKEDPIVGRMKVVSLLESLPGFGKVRAQKVMEEVGIDSSRRIGGLGSSQLAKLIDKLS